MIYPKISIVTSSYNQGHFLEETIESVLSQKYPNFEYIIIDGGSTDNSVEIIKKYQDKLAHWESEKDRGFGHAMNKGFNKSTGEILCWINSDDLLLPGALLLVGNYFTKYKEVGVVFGDRYVIDEKSTFVSKKYNYFFIKRQLRYKTIPQESTFWRRDHFFNVGGIDEGLKFAIDLDLWCRLVKITSIRHIPYFLGAFRLHKDSKTSTLDAVRLSEKKSILLKYYNYAPGKMENAIFYWIFLNMRRIYRFLALNKLKMIYYNSVLK